VNVEKTLTLVLGGARSGKSVFAERLAREGGRVLFAASAEAKDDDMARRIAAHRARRPASWDTLEAPIDLASELAEAADGYDTVLLDCLTVWVANLLLRRGPGPGAEAEAATAGRELLRAYEEGSAAWIVVSNEVGLGVVPPTELGRDYRDALGRVNQLVAQRADRVYLTVAGLATELKALGAQPVALDEEA
jgi:adenosylcobinamide kinase/adenosylcobinamide-phosphate guanylyltransferase